MLKSTRDKKKKHNKIVMLARSKLNGIETKISEALIDHESNHKDFTTIINEEKNYRELKESIRMTKLKEVMMKKIIWLKRVKEKVLMKLLDKVQKYRTMLFYCLKCRKNTKNINLKISVTSNGKTMILSSCAI